MMGTRVAGLAALLLAAACGQAQPAGPRTFYVDFDGGSDAAAGTSPANPWKRAPGDAQATGRAAETQLRPGDRVIFRGGVRYRGTIRVTAAGAADAPIVFSGSGWQGQALIDGSDPLPPPQPCPSADACLGAAGASRVAVPADAQWWRWLFGSGGAYRLAQWPADRPNLDYDDLDRFAEIPRNALARLQAGEIPARLPPGLARGAPALVLWSRPNRLVYAQSFTPGGDGIAFTAPRFQPYTDRPNRFSIVNAPLLVTAPGLYALSGPDGVAVLRPRPGETNLSLGSGRQGFVLARGAANIVIRDFGFERFAGEPGNVRSGVPVLAIGATTGVRVENNRFADMALVNGQGVISLPFAADLRIAGNVIERIAFGSGVRVGQSRGPVEISCNRIRDIGRTGIMTINVLDVTIRGNALSGINGIHGNGISAYLDNRRVRITDNVVHDSIRPLTLGRPAKPFFEDAAPRSITVENNLLIGNDKRSAAAVNYGRGLEGIAMRGNILGGPGGALRVQGDEAGALIEDNALGGELIVTREDAGTVERRGNRGASDAELRRALAERLARQDRCR